MGIDQEKFQTNLAIWQSAVAVYELNLKHGGKSGDEEFRRWFKIAKELTYPNGTTKKRR